jgi:SsrA-binding protein
MKVMTQNKKARHDYTILDIFECGIVLKGTEIKSIRAGHVGIAESYCSIRNNQMYIINMYIGPFKEGNMFNVPDRRDRVLLMHKKEILKLSQKVSQQSLTIVPLRVYIKDGLAKVEIALAKGKKQHDKRQSLKEKQAKREMDKVNKHRF